MGNETRPVQRRGWRTPFARPALCLAGGMLFGPLTQYYFGAGVRAIEERRERTYPRYSERRWA